MKSTYIVLLLLNALFFSIGFSNGMQKGWRQHEAIYRDSLEVVRTDELNYYFSDSSYQQLFGHRLHIPENFGDLGAYRTSIKFPLYGWTDDWGTIHIEQVPYGSIDSARVESDIDKDEL